LAGLNRPYIEGEKMKPLKVFSLVLVFVLVLAACAPAATPTAAPEEAESKEITIGMANFSQCCAYFIGMNNSVIDEASVYPNVTIISTDANGDAAKLNSDIEDLIAKKVDGIIISGAWLEQLPSALDSIQKAGIPAVLVDRQWTGGYTSYVGPENFVIGQQDGQYIVDRLAGEGILPFSKVTCR
jgi:ABC-type sugar transport system substrate-binding protein